MESFKLYRVIIPVPDIEGAVQIYQTLFNADGQRVSRGRHYFDLGGVVFALYDPQADGDTHVGDTDADGDSHAVWAYHDNQYVYIAVSDIDAVFRRAQKAEMLHVDESIRQMPWGETLFYARDPYGTPICFVDEKTVFTGIA